LKAGEMINNESLLWTLKNGWQNDENVQESLFQPNLFKNILGWLKTVLINGRHFYYQYLSGKIKSPFGYATACC
jgi:hypothetical protein